VIGILASVIAFPFLAGTFHPAGLRDTGLMGVLLLPASCSAVRVGGERAAGARSVSEAHVSGT
jgi:hypothetical protein